PCPSSRGPANPPRLHSSSSPVPSRHAASGPPRDRAHDQLVASFARLGCHSRPSPPGSRAGLLATGCESPRASFLEHLEWVAEYLIVLGRFQAVLAIFRNRKFAGQFFLQMPWSGFSSKGLGTNFLLQRHKRMDERLRSRRATGNMHIDGDKAIDSLEHVVAIAKRTAGNG